MGNSVPGFRGVKISTAPREPRPLVIVAFPEDGKRTSNCGTKLIWDFNLCYRPSIAAA